MWDDVRKLFPITETCVYLNNAGVAPPSIRVIEALQGYHIYHARYGAPALFQRYGQLGHRIKEIIGSLLHCDTASIALIHNTSEGMSIVAQGMDWRPGDVILGLHGEYPANVYPWRNLECRGVKYVQVGTLDSQDDVALIEQASHQSVRMIAVSAVNWRTGASPDLARLGRLCGRLGAVLVVDAAQGLGVVPLYPRDFGAAAMAGSAWKWLMGPVGLGVFYCAPNFLDTLSLSFVGTNTVVDAYKYLNDRFVPKPDASRFEFSTANFNDWAYFLASLELLQEIGVSEVRERIVCLNRYLREGLDRRGYQVVSTGDAGEPSGIISFRREGLDATETVARLADAKIIVVERSAAIRVSPHIYNNEEDMDRLLNELR